jgi:hypothetical protein
MTFSDRLIQQQSEREATIKIEKEYKESMAEAEKDLSKEKAKIEEQQVKDTQAQKDAELKIIKDYQKSRLSELTQEKNAVKDNYKELTALYKKYGMDTEQLTKDKNKALKDLEIQGYTSSLDKLSNYVRDARDIWDGLTSTWDTVVKTWDFVITKLSKTPDTTGMGNISNYINTASQGGNVGIPNVPKIGVGGTAAGAKAIGSKIAGPLMVASVGIAWYKDYQTGKKLDDAKLKSQKEYSATLQDLVKTTELTAEQANFLFIQYQHENDKFKKGMIVNEKYMTYQEIQDYIDSILEKSPIRDTLKLARDNRNTIEALQIKGFEEYQGYQRSRIKGMGYAESAAQAIPVQTGNQAPSANLNINFNLAPNQQQIDGLTRDVELSARKQGFRVKVGRNA